MVDLVYLHCGPNNVITNTVPGTLARNPDGTVKTTEWHFLFLNYDSPATRAYLIAAWEWKVLEE